MNGGFDVAGTLELDLPAAPLAQTDTALATLLYIACLFALVTFVPAAILVWRAVL